MSTAYGAVTVTTNATLILGANLRRRGFIIQNNEASATIYVGFDASVTATTGLAIAAGGNYISAGPEEGWKGNIYGIVVSSTGNVRYEEWEG